MKYMLVIMLINMLGCVSLGYHERKIREAKGEVTVRVDEDQEYRNFMEHKRGVEE